MAAKQLRLVEHQHLCGAASQGRSRAVKGDPPPALKPVDAYRDYKSPFGLYDTVGNAGDWVINDISSYDRVYMGATYRFNPEDATAFRMLPVTDSDYLVREITARCVSPGKR